MTKALDQRREERIAARDAERREDAELDLPLLNEAMTAITGDLSAARDKVVVALKNLIVTHPQLEGQVRTLGMLEDNLTNIVGGLLKDAQAVLNPPAETPAFD